MSQIKKVLSAGVLVFASFLFSFTAHAAIVFQDNFDSDCSGAACNSGGGTSSVPTGWDQWMADDSQPVTIGGATHYGGEISAPGRDGSGKSLKIWRYNGYYGNYTGSLVKIFSGSNSNLWFRYYLKIPPAWQITGGDGYKQWRFNVTGGGGELYLNVLCPTGDCASNQTWGLYNNASWTTVLNNSDYAALRDGNWHAVQWNINLSSGAVALYIDNMSKFSGTIANIGGTFQMIQHFPIGNSNASHVWVSQNSWQAEEIDDVIIATTKAETDPIVSSHTPVISSVFGTIATGQTLVISGTTMVDENKANWTSRFSTGTPYGFEGSDPASDGYDNQGGNNYNGTYDSNIKLMGNKSIRFHAQGASSDCPAGNLASASYFGDSLQDKYIRGYVRWNATNNVWPSGYTKMLYDVNSYYYQPNMNSGGIPYQIDAHYDSTTHPFTVNNWPIQNNRWYYVEARWKYSTPYRFTAWVDNQQITDIAPSGGSVAQWIIFGLINLCDTPSNFSMDHWWDGLTVSTSRIYPSSVIEIGNSPTYTTATKVYQEPLFLSDGSIQIKANLTGLGSGPYYLFVTNNRQERSAAYALSGGGSDTPPTWPTGTTFSASADSSSSITVTWSAATDDHGVASYQVQRCTGLPPACSDASFSQVGTPTASPFVNNTGLSANTDYSYRVRAVDTIGQVSGWTNVVSARTQPGTPAPTFTFTANPTSITVGGSSTLTWSAVTNATSCTATGGTFTGTKSTSGGTQSVSPTSTTTYTLSCTGAGGTTNQSATVTVTGGTGTTFFSEGYENTSFASRGWYDITTGTVDTAEHHSGASSLRCTYNAGANNCTAPNRHKFTDSNSAYISYWTKYSTNFVGSGQGYHPHEFLLLTNQNGDYDGLAFDYLTMYLESHWSGSSNGIMMTGFQDGQNIDQSRIGDDLIGVTENRAVAGCNGSPSGYAGGCYDRGDGVYVNGVLLSTPQTFTTANKNNWNHVEAFYQLNSISNGIGQADGILRIWFNDALVFERTNAILRTGAQPDMRFNQFIFGPWIGDGSPVTQTMWIDDLEVRDSRPGTTTTPVACNTVSPTNFPQSAYNAYGAPYDLFSSNAPLVDARCTSADTHTITATIGKMGDATRIVYTRGYYYDLGVNNWVQYTGTCTGTLNGEWCAGPTTATITDADLSTASSGTPAYFVGMVCSVQGGGWKCGCRDTSCTNFYWQIQGAGQ